MSTLALGLGLHKTARYYYHPGRHEPGNVNELSFNKKAYEALPVDLQRTLVGLSVPKLRPVASLTSPDNPAHAGSA